MPDDNSLQLMRRTYHSQDLLPQILRYVDPYGNRYYVLLHGQNETHACEEEVNMEVVKDPKYPWVNKKNGAVISFHVLHKPSEDADVPETEQQQATKGSRRPKTSAATSKRTHRAKRGPSKSKANERDIDGRLIGSEVDTNLPKDENAVNDVSYIRIGTSDWYRKEKKKDRDCPVRAIVGAETEKVNGQFNFNLVEVRHTARSGLVQDQIQPESTLSTLKCSKMLMYPIPVRATG